MLAKYGKIIAILTIAYIALNVIIGIGWLGSTSVHKYGQGTVAKQSFDPDIANAPIYLLNDRRSTEAVGQHTQLVSVILSGISLLIFIFGTVNLCILGYTCFGVLHCLTCGGFRIGDIILFILFLLNRIYDASGNSLQPM